MTTKAEKTLRLLIDLNDKGEFMTLTELTNELEIRTYNRTEKILRDLCKDGYISKLRLGTGLCYGRELVKYDIEEKAREHFENLEAEAKTKAEQQAQIVEQRRHNWKIALFSTIGGSIAGLITSLIFWLITK